MDGTPFDQAREILEFTTTGFALKDLRGRFLDVNPAFCTLLGYERHELIGQGYQLVTHPDDRQRTEEVLERFRSGAWTEFSWTKRYLTKGGATVVCRKKLSLFRRQGDEGILLLQIEDVGNEVAVQDERERLRVRTQAVIDHLPGMIGFWDQDLNNVFANKVYREFFGWSPEELHGRHLSELLGPELFQKNLPQFQRALAGEAVTFERVLTDTSGNERQTIASYVPGFHQGKVEGVYVFVTDNTALKAALSARLEAQRDLQTVLDAATDFSIIATDKNGTIRLFSRGAEKLLGYAADELVGRATPSVIHDADEVRTREGELAESGHPGVQGFEVFIQEANRGLSERRTWTYLRKDGGRVPVSLVVSPIGNPDGTVVGYLGVARDVSGELESRREIIAAREAAEAATLSKSQFLANMSHEIRTPMNGVLGVTQLLAETELNERQASLVEMIENAGQTLLAIINDILDLSKIEAGKMELAAAPFSLSRVLAAVEGILSLKAQEKGIALGFQTEAAFPDQVLGDALRLQQILMNLVGNAVKFTEKGSVSVLVRRPKSGPEPRDEWEFVVRDTGVGMAQDQLERIFLPFVQAPLSRQGGGTGLGLSISKSLTDLMGGTLTVSSQVGAGSEFCLRLTLPTAANEAPVLRSVEGTEGRLEGWRFLVVDDAPLNLFVAAGLLKSLGAEVVTANDGRQAVDLLAAGGERFDAVLMDVQMPEMNGLEATRLIRNQLGLDLPILGLSAGVTADEQDQCRQAGMDGFLGKPFHKAQLIATLGDLAVGRA